MYNVIGGGGRYYRRDERRGQVAYHVALAHASGQDGHTMYSMARILNMQPSSHLGRLLNGMVSENLLTYKDVKHRSTVNKRRYFPARKLYCDTLTGRMAEMGNEAGKAAYEAKALEASGFVQESMF